VDYRKEARELVHNLDQRMSPSTYDIAWLARLRDTENGEARWPDMIDWLLATQHQDGSWGGEIVYYHDRILCTLAGAIALRENGQSPRAQVAIGRAERFLWHHLHLLPRDPADLSGFELIFPTLLEEARSLGLDVPKHTCGYGERQTAKLRLIPPEMLYSRHISTVYSLEFLGRFGDAEKLQAALSPNGSLGDSPASTAYYLTLCPGQVDGRALEYLETVRQRNRVITVYPFRVFELAWVLNNLLYSGLPLTAFVSPDVCGELYAEMKPTGIALDPTFGPTDGDITSVCTRVLLSAGYEVDPLILAHFEDKETRIFHTYPYELNVSMSTNIHALDALRLMTNYPDREEVRKQVTVALLNYRQYGTYWTDKWHASPYYATSHALIALLAEGMYLAHACRHTVDWLLHTQQSDGSWGFFQLGTIEETAYALEALLHYNQHEKIDPDILHRGAAYLAERYQGAQASFPELWLAKSIYSPYDIVRSAILTALILYEETFGRGP